MFGFESFGKTLLLIGGVIILVGVVFIIAEKTGLGRLPGDIVIKRENITVFFPLATMVIISIVLTIVANFLRRF